MRVGLNATCLNDRPSGAKQRFVGIYGSLIQRLPDVEFVIYEPADCRVADWFSRAPNVSARRTPIPSEGFYGKFIQGLQYWPWALRREHFDLFECFNQPLVRSGSSRTFTTIHDIRQVYADWKSPQRHLYTYSLRQALTRVDQAITVSATMKAEILAFHPGAKVSVIYNGLNPRLFSEVTEGEAYAVRCKFGLPTEFVLAVGHFETRKNYLRLIDAIALLRDRGFDCNLVIVGNDSGERRLVEERVGSAKLTNNVKILTGLSDQEVRCIYRLSRLFAFPSSYEGFGIPILEAMAAGIPVILSDIPVFREITENQVIYFTPASAEAMAAAIEQTLSSSGQMDALRAYGHRRVQDFSFERISAQLAELYMSSPKASVATR
jgi:glycosyltransferase involved in cell wall biosynthesis